jgi:Antitoxin VbhA
MSVSITDQERAERATASVRLEGLEPTDAAKSIFERYVSGEVTRLDW